MENNFKVQAEKLGAFSLPRYADLPELDLYMDQVISVSEKYLSLLAVGEKSLITPSMINNYVKNGVIPPPVRKRYSREHLAAIIIVCALKSTVEIQDIALIIRNSCDMRGMEKTFNSFAQMYEDRIKSLASAARDISENGAAPYRAIVENAVLSSAARIIVEYAMASVDRPKPDDAVEVRRHRRRKGDDDEDEEISVLPVI